MGGPRNKTRRMYVAVPLNLEEQAKWNTYKEKTGIKTAPFLRAMIMERITEASREK